MENINRKQKYDLINYFLNEYCLRMEDTFFYEYIPEFFFLSVCARKIMDSHDQSLQIDPRFHSFLNLENKLTKEISYPETLGIVRNYLQERLPQYAPRFEEILGNGIINIVVDDDGLENDRQDHQGYVRKDNHYFINVVLRHDYSDAPRIIHEFIHYLNNPQPNEVLTSTRQLLTETISRFFQIDVLKYMSENGYDKVEAAKVVRDYITDCYNLCEEMQVDLSMINAYKYLGDLSDDSFEDSRNLGLSIKRRTKEDYLEDIDMYFDILCRRKTSPDVITGYFLSTFIALGAHEKNDQNTFQNFVRLNEEVNSKSTSDCLKMIGINLNKIDSINELITNFEIANARVEQTLMTKDNNNVK